MTYQILIGPQNNELIEGFGIEAIRGEWVSHYWQNSVALYINTGDVYNDTVLYDTINNRYLVTTMGDWVEHYERIGGEVE